MFGIFKNRNYHTWDRSITLNYNQFEVCPPKKTRPVIAISINIWNKSLFIPFTSIDDRAAKSNLLN